MAYEYDCSDKVKHALQIAHDCAQTDGAHHKMWCIDQMVRALTDCPVVPVKSKYSGIEYDGLGESQEYLDFVKEYQGEWDEEYHGYEYEWECGTPP